MKCLNTRGCNKDAKYVKEINSSNFCCYECYLIYTGKKKPPVPIQKRFKDSERQQLHDLYLWTKSGKKPNSIKRKRRVPPSSEWKVDFKDGTTYIWDDFKEKYVRYILGIGLIDFSNKKCKYVVVADENSEYYRAVFSRINEVQTNPKLTNNEPIYKPRMKQGVKKGDKRGPYKVKKRKNKTDPSYTKVCPDCKRTFITTNKNRKYYSNACKQRHYRKVKIKRELDRKKNIFNNI